MYVQPRVKLSTVVYRSRCSNTEFLANEIRQTSPSRLILMCENDCEKVGCGWDKSYMCMSMYISVCFIVNANICACFYIFVLFFGFFVCR